MNRKRIVKIIKKEIRNLSLAWFKYLNKGFAKLTKKNRLIVNIAMFCLFFLGIVFLVVKSLVYAQGEVVIPETINHFPLERFFSWIMGGGLASIFIRFARKNYLKLKRAFDIIISAVFLILLSPLFLIIGLITKIDSDGAVFFKQERLGQNGKLFEMWKFRTMRQNAELETGPVWTQEDDPRITKIGQFLRKSHLDELPQLINVFRGDMSLIGPRPERPEFTEIITRKVPNFTKRLDVKPGITGLAQVRYRYGASIKDSERKLKFDSIYIDKMSWFFDFKIALWTVKTMLTGEGAR